MHGLKRVLILYRAIPRYRKAAFNGLADHYDVTVLHPGPPTAGPTDNYREVIVPARAVGPFVLQQQVAATLARHRPDVVIAMLDLRWPAQLLPILARNRHARWIFWGPGYGRSRVANRVRDALVRRADALLLYGSTEVDAFVRRGMPRDRIFVAPNTIHVPNHRDLSGERKSSLLFVGRLQKRKRLDLLIDAFAKSRRRATRRHDVGDRRRHAGAGIPAGGIWALQARLGNAFQSPAEGRSCLSADVDMPGFVENPFSYMARSAVFALSSDYEGLGCVIVQALAVGCPVVSTDCPVGPQELLDGGAYGRLVPVGDRDALAGALIAALDESPNQQRLRRRSLHYSTGRMVGQYLDVLLARPTGRSEQDPRIGAAR